MPELDLATRMRESVVHAGGAVSYYIAAPVITYVGAPVVNYLAPPTIAVVGSAIASIPLSAPVAFGMAVSFAYGIPKMIAYPVTMIKNHSRAAGESATESLIDNSKKAITYLFSAATSSLYGVYNRISNPKKSPDENEDGEWIELEREQPLIPIQAKF